MLSTAFGVLMIACTALRPQGFGVVVAVLAAAAVAVGIVARPVCTVAVVLAVAAIVLTDPPVVFAALSGLSAVGYLLLRHAADSSAATVTLPTVVGALAFTAVGIAAVMVPLQMSWVPLLAPAAVVAIYAVATRPYAPRSVEDLP